MKARPILFSAPMVRALLDGTKVQTRRIIKPRGGDEIDPEGIYENHPGDIELARCPYGQVGDLLWVRESFGLLDDKTILYPATYDMAQRPWLNWKPSIHMPRTASRITLGITSVRVERLQSISRGDAMDEGCPFPNMAKGPNPVDWYADLWREINGSESWEANPWVYAIDFVVHHANVDELLRAAREAGAA